jgi:hypothetical protein
MAIWRATCDKRQANKNDKRARKQHKESKERNTGRAASATSAVVFETLEPRVLLNASLKVALSARGVGALNVQRGTANLNGTLMTVPAAGFAPSIGNLFTFLTFPARSGTFASIQQGALPPGEALSLDTALNLDVVAA